MKEFIRSVRLRPPLWDTRHPEHNNKLFIRNLWHEMEDEVEIERGSGPRRWKNLKDTFRRELNKIRTDMKPSSWVFFQDLVFLKDIIFLRRGAQYPDVDFMKVKGTPLTEEQYDRLIHTNSSPPRTKRGRPPNRRHNGQKRSKTEFLAEGDEDYGNSICDVSDFDCGEGLSAECESVSSEHTTTAEAPPDDLVKAPTPVPPVMEAELQGDNYHFLMSFLQHMKRMSDEKNLRLRIKMQAALYEIMYDEGTPPATEFY